MKGLKLRFLKEHPNWRTEFSQLDPSVVPPSDSEEEEREEETETITVEETNDTNIRPEETVTVEMGTPQKRRVPWRQRPRHRRRSSWIRDPSRGGHHRDDDPCRRVAHLHGGGHRGDRGDIHDINNSSRRTPTTMEAEPTVPHVHEATGEPLPVITITYPLQNSLDCPHCLTNFPGDIREDAAGFSSLLKALHSEQRQLR